MPILVKCDAGYADEFDCESFVVMKDQDALARYMERVKKGINEGDTEWYFGTNEALQFESFEDFSHTIEVVHISDEEAKMLHKLFGSPRGETSFGLGVLIYSDYFYTEDGDFDIMR